MLKNPLWPICHMPDAWFSSLKQPNLLQILDSRIKTSDFMVLQIFQKLSMDFTVSVCLSVCLWTTLETSGPVREESCPISAAVWVFISHFRLWALRHVFGGVRSLDRGAVDLINMLQLYKVNNGDAPCQKKQENKTWSRRRGSISFYS